MAGGLGEAGQRGTGWLQIAPSLESSRTWREPPSLGLVWTSQRNARNSEGFVPGLEAGVCPQLQD